MDLAAPGLLRRTTWRWFCVRLRCLSPDAITRNLKPEKVGDGRDAMSALAAAAAR